MGISIWHWLILASFLANAVLMFRVIWRMGFNPLWGLLTALPLVSTAVWWSAAFRPWPKGSPR